MSRIKDIELLIEKSLAKDKNSSINHFIQDMEDEVNKSLQLHILLSSDSLKKYIAREKKRTIYSDETLLFTQTIKHLCEFTINFVKQNRDSYWSKISKELNKKIEKSILEKFSYLEQCLEEKNIIVDNIHSLEKIAEANPVFTPIEQVEDLAKEFTVENIEEEQLSTIISKIATLQMTGILDLLYENDNFKNSGNKLAGFLSKLLAENKASIQPILSAINTYRNDQSHHSKNNPFVKEEAINKLSELLISTGIDPITLEKNTPK